MERSRLPSQRHSQIWPPPAQEQQASLASADEKTKQKKKKKGLFKIWKLVKGSSVKDNPRIVSGDRHDDFPPLAPPPPLSYLVERGPGEHLNNGGRHASTPSLPSTASPWNGFSSPGMSPPTAPSSLLPSPTSSRPSGGNGDATDRKNGGQNEEKEVHDASVGENGRFKPVHPVTSEPDIRRKSRPISMPQNVVPVKPSPRPPMLSREKSLPPLPGEAKVKPQIATTELRPQMPYDGRLHSQDTLDLAPPNAPFLNEARRQSFSGVPSRPALGIQTMPNGGALDHARSPNGLYNEFGTSRRSLGRLGDIDEHPPLPATPKRKNKFAFVSLLGKKSSNLVNMNGSNSHEFPRISTSGFDPIEDPLYSSYPSPRQASRPRMSMMSRKAIEELVEQDREFVAYRYPSTSNPPVDLIR